MIRNLFLVFSFLYISHISGQKNVNDFKYVMIPEGYVFLSENDEYQLNSLTKFLFEKYGFTAFMRDEELPVELRKNGCLAMTADVLKKPGLFLTKLVVELKDCNGAIIFTSSEGQSREKEFKKSYQQALRNAFKDVQKLNYRYNKNAEKGNVVHISPQQNTEVSIEKPVIERVQDNTQIAEPVGVSIVKEKVDQVTPPITDANKNLYSWNDKDFMFSKQEYGYDFIEIKEEDQNILGKIFASERENTYIIKAGDYSGNGYFDAYGNFVLERINPVNNKLIKDVFARE